MLERRLCGACTLRDSYCLIESMIHEATKNQLLGPEC